MTANPNFGRRRLTDNANVADINGTTYWGHDWIIHANSEIVSRCANCEERFLRRLFHGKTAAARFDGLRRSTKRGEVFPIGYVPRGFDWAPHRKMVRCLHIRKDLVGITWHMVRGGADSRRPSYFFRTNPSGTRRC